MSELWTLIGVGLTTIAGAYAAARKAATDDKKAVLDRATAQENNLSNLLTGGTETVIKVLREEIERLKAALVESAKRMDEMQSYIDQVKADTRNRLDAQEQGITMLVEQIRAQGLDPVWHPPVPEGEPT